ncbi:MAG: crossover junction endodeoxyribonuclease RuvC [Spirochaetaceae bacterium]|nr:crossover junction endodeoxyribonuclease RuvC [Spirochaetaceae bacterium]
MARIIIGIDPGLAAVGFGVIGAEKGRIIHIDHGCITTSSNLSSSQRLQLIYNAIGELIRRYRPDSGGIEDLYFFRNVSSALPVAEARGVIKLAFQVCSVPLAEFSPNEIKKAVTGTARADKALVQEMVRMLLGLDVIPKPDHAADALAAAICRIHSEGPAGTISPLSPIAGN